MALIAKLCPRLAAMLASASEGSNFPKASVSAECRIAPNFVEIMDENSKEDKKELLRDKEQKMSIEDVHKARVDKNPHVLQFAGFACISTAQLIGANGWEL